MFVNKKKLGKFNGEETKVMVEECSSDFVDKLDTEYSSGVPQVLPKLQSIIEFLSLNLSDLY